MDQHDQNEPYVCKEWDMLDALDMLKKEYELALIFFLKTCYRYASEEAKDAHKFHLINTQNSS